MQRRSPLPVLVASAIVLAVYVAALAVVPLDVFWHPDEGAKYVGVETVRFDGTISYSVPYPGARLDPSRQFYPANVIYPAPKADGGVAFNWPPLFMIASRPLLDAFGVAGIYVLPAACGWLTALLAGLWGLRFVPRTAPIAVLLVGLASPVAFYSLGFFEHTLTTLIASLALTLLIARPGSVWALALATPLMALLVVLRVEMLALVAALAGAWAIVLLAQASWAPRGLLRSGSPGRVLVAVGALLALVVVVVFFTDLVPARHRARLEKIPWELDGVWGRRQYFFDTLVRVFLGAPAFADFSLLRLWQISALLSLFALVAAPFVESRRIEAALLLPALFVLLQTALLTVLATVPFLERQGVLAVAPYLGVALYGVPVALRRRDPALLTLAAASALYAGFGFLLIFATRVAAHDGSSFLGLDGAARYVLLLYPTGAVLALVALAHWREERGPGLVTEIFTGMMIGLMVLALAYEALGLRELARKRQVLVRWRQELERQPPVLTDQWWLPAVLAPHFVRHEIYVLNQKGDLEAWLAAASAAGVKAFTYASRSPLPARLLEGGLDARDSETVLDLTLTRIRFPQTEPLPPGG